MRTARFLVPLSVLVLLLPCAPAGAAVLFSEDFESYETGTFPASGGWTVVYNGAGDAYQVVSDTLAASGTKSFSSTGSSCWAATIFRPVDMPDRVSVEGSVYVDAIVGCGCTPSLAQFGIYRPPSEGEDTTGRIHFGCDGNIYAEDEHLAVTDLAKMVLVAPYTAGRWYRIRVDYDVPGRTFDVWVDGTLARAGIPIQGSSWTPTGIAVGGHHGAGPTARYDDIEVAEPYCAARPQGLVSWWRFEEGAGATASDSVRTNDGTLVGGPTWTAEGEVGGALTFDGADDYVAVPRESTWDFGTGSFSLAAWFRTTVTGTEQNIIRYDNGLSGGFWGLRVEADGSLMMLVVNGARIGIGLQSPGTYADGQWHHAVGVRDSAAGKVILYVDGLPVAETADSGTDVVGAPDAAPAIGRCGSYDGGYFAGDLDEPQVYGSALSDAKIAAIHAYGNEGMCIEDYVYRTVDFPDARGVSFATGINDRGDIVGVYLEGGQPAVGFLLKDGAWTTISYPGYAPTWVSGINNDGLVVGWAPISIDGSCLLWQDGVYDYFHKPGTYYTECQGVNDAGEKAINWYHGTGAGSDIHIPAGDTYEPLAFGANDLSNTGLAVGSVADGGGGSACRVYDRGTGTSEDFTWPGGCYAKGVNDAGVVVGGNQDSIGQSFVRDGSGFTRIRVPGSEKTMAEDVNNDGLIVGWYVASGLSHGFVAVPRSRTIDMRAYISLPPGPSLVGSELVYSFSVIHDDPLYAEGVVLTHAIPEGASFLWASPTQGDCALDSGTLRCDFGSVQAGFGAGVNVAITLPATPGTLQVGAGVTTDSFDRDPGNDYVQSETLVVKPVVSLNPAGGVGFGLVEVGEASAPVVFTVANTGTGTLEVTFIEIFGGAASNFAVVPGGPDPCPDLSPSLVQGEDCTVEVTFEPEMAGFTSAALRVASNDPAAQIVSRSVSGFGLWTLDVAVDPAGSGRVLGSGIDCPGDCTESFPVDGAAVSLLAGPAENYRFLGWGPGEPLETANPLDLILDDHLAVTALFAENVLNPSFEEETPAPWTRVKLTVKDKPVDTVFHTGTRSFKIVGGLPTKTLRQSVSLSGGAGETLVLKAWSKARKTSALGGFYGAKVKVVHADGTSKTYKLPFTKRTHAWELKERSITTAAPYTSVLVSLVYARQTGIAWFDDVTLSRE